MKVLVLSSLLLLSVTGTPLDGSKAAPVPVVLWHGMGDSAAGMTGIEVFHFCQAQLQLQLQLS